MTVLEKFRIDELVGTIHLDMTSYFVICCHGLYSSKDSQKHLEFSRHVENKGYSCVRFDFSGCGESKGIFSYSLADRVYDLSNVIDYIKSEYGPVKIALFGSSFGAMISLAYASNNPISSIVAMATPARFAIKGITNDITQEASRCSHALFMHGIRDELVSHEESKLLYAYSQTPKKIIMFNTDHRFTDNNEREKALLEGIKWVIKYFNR